MSANEELAIAVVAGDLKAAHSALESGADPAMKCEDCIPLLFLAAARGDLAMVRTLVEAGADVKALDHWKGSVLKYVASCPPMPRTALIVQYLVDRGADPACAISDPVGNAIIYRNEVALKALMSAGGKAPYCFRDHPEIVKLRLAAESDPGRSAR